MAPRNKGGRPRKLMADEATLKIVSQCAAVMSTVEDAADVFGVDKKTFLTFMRLTAVKEAWEQGQARGKLSLRRRQFAHTETSWPAAQRMGELYLKDQRDALFEEKLAGREQQPQIGDTEVVVQMIMTNPGGGQLVYDPTPATIKTIEHQPATNGHDEPATEAVDSEPDEPGTVYIDVD